MKTLRLFCNFRTCSSFPPICALKRLVSASEGSSQCSQNHLLYLTITVDKIVRYQGISWHVILQRAQEIKRIIYVSYISNYSRVKGRRKIISLKLQIMYKTDPKTALSFRASLWLINSVVCNTLFMILLLIYFKLQITDYRYFKITIFFTIMTQMTHCILG